jgi:hypothetical protein
MDIYRTISAQVQTMRLPLFAVTLTAAPRRNTPVLLQMHWHAFLRDEAAARAPTDPQPVASSALQVSDKWQDLCELEQSMLEAAWQSGAWELCREQRRGCNTVGADEREATACRQAYGDDPLQAVGQSHAICEAPDRAEMMQLGARIGYIRWLYRPVRGGCWPGTAGDVTRATDGSRALPCPVAPSLDAAHKVAQTSIRLGRIEKIFLL